MATEDVIQNRVREVRRRLKLRQEDLAHEVGVTRQTIIALERGRLQNPSVMTCLKIAKVLREPVEYLFYLGTPTEAVQKPLPAKKEAESEAIVHLNADRIGREAVSVQLVDAVAAPAEHSSHTHSAQPFESMAQEEPEPAPPLEPTSRLKKEVNGTGQAFWDFT